MLNGLKRLSLIIKLEYLPISKSLILLELITAIIKLGNIITQAHDGYLFDILVDLEQVLEWKFDHDYGLDICVFLFEVFLFNSEDLVSEIWEEQDFFLTDVEGEVGLVGARDDVAVDEVDVGLWRVVGS